MAGVFGEERGPVAGTKSGVILSGAQVGRWAEHSRRSSYFLRWVETRRGWEIAGKRMSFLNFARDDPLWFPPRGLTRASRSHETTRQMARTATI